MVKKAYKLSDPPLSPRHAKSDCVLNGASPDAHLLGSAQSIGYLNVGFGSKADIKSRPLSTLLPAAFKRCLNRHPFTESIPMLAAWGSRW